MLKNNYSVLNTDEMAYEHQNETEKSEHAFSGQQTQLASYMHHKLLSYVASCGLNDSSINKSRKQLKQSHSLSIKKYKTTNAYTIYEVCYKSSSTMLSV